MSIRLPLKTLVAVNDTATTGTASYNFFVPQDSEGIVVKAYTGATFTGTNPTVDIYIQTSDDGGTTWYDTCNLGQFTAAVSAQNARWAAIPVAVPLARTQGASVLAIGAAAASTATVQQYTGIPVLGQINRVYLKYGGTQLTNSGVLVNVYSNSQSNSR